MKLKIQMQKKDRQGGFSLLEALLAVGLFAGILFAISQILNDLAKKELARSTAQYTENIANAVESTLVNDLNHFNAFYDDILATNGGIAVCDVNPCSLEYNLTGAAPSFLNGFTLGALTIPPSSVLNDNFSDTNPLKSPVRVIISLASDSGEPPALHVLIASMTRAPDSLVRAAASESGPNGGSLRAGTGIRSAYGTWQFNTAQFSIGAVPTSWVGTVTDPATIPDPNAGGTYYVYYKYINFSDTSGDYMYREQQTNPELHTMRSSLNMGGNSILGVDNIVTGGTLEVENQIIVQGSAHIENNLTLNAGSLFSDGTAEMDNVTIQNNLIGANSFLSDGALAVTNLQMQNDGRIDAEEAELNNIIVTELDVAEDSGNNLGDANLIGTNARYINNGAAGHSSFRILRIQSHTGPTDITIEDDLNSIQLDLGSGDTINSTGDIGIIQLGVNNSSSAVNVDLGGSLNAPVVNVELIDLNNGSFGNCDKGCGN